MLTRAHQWAFHIPSEHIQHLTADFSKTFDSIPNRFYGLNFVCNLHLAVHAVCPYNLKSLNLIILIILGEE